MSTKQQIKTNIDTKYASGSSMPISNVRDVLKNDTESFLENMYMSKITDTQATQNELTLVDDVNADFTIDIVKIGRVVTIQGVFQPVSTEVVILGNITRAEFAAKLFALELPTRGLFGIGTDDLGTPYFIEVRNDAGTTNLRVQYPASGQPLQPGRILTFSINYFTDL